jgi:hypothetical protein
VEDTLNQENRLDSLAIRRQEDLERRLALALNQESRLDSRSLAIRRKEDLQDQLALGAYLQAAGPWLGLRKSLGVGYKFFVRPLLPSFVQAPGFKDFIASGLQYESIEEFEKAVGCAEQSLSRLEFVWEQLETRRMIKNLFKACDGLLDECLLELADQPRQFRTELDNRIRQIASLVRKIFALPDHRMIIRAERDLNLWRLKRAHPEWTFGELALRFGLRPGGAKQAYEREASRQKRRLVSLHNLALVLQSMFPCGTHAGS